MCNLVYWIGKLLHPDNWKADLDYISGNITQEGERLILDSLEMRFSSYKNDFPSVIESLGIDGLNLSSNDRNLVLTLRRSGLEELNALIELAGQNARYCEAFHLEELKGLTVETLLANVHMPM
ncbi:MAG: hypothetical protein NDI94_05715, partial [Candidatus Woesearchaeota archaeon]|nr:hypothetical protein [Candidatus Woesearchaeota archaeon]